ncbi:hypothetical protein PspLS_07321 [Pyricularia sp. CBS 133598]|nr:hypothetical protein PspLS_07321 [Pyricularia sp. CBS 133598]
MAGNMPQMAGMMQPQQRPPFHPNQVTQIVFKHLAEQPPILTGWQSGLSMQERLGKTCQLVTQFRMAMPNEMHTAKCIELGLTCERRALVEAPDRNAYEQLMQSKMAELQNKRMQSQHHMQNNVNQQAAFMHQQQQHQKQQQQQRMMQNAAHAAAQAQMNGGMGPNSQLPFQHLQHQMQASPIPQQSSTPMQMGMGGMGGIANQANMPMGAGVQDNSMTMADKQKILEVAKQNYTQAPEHTKQQIRMQMATKMTPQQQNDFRSKGIDPVLHWFQNQAINQFRRSKMMAQQGLSGMPNQGMVNMQQQRPGAVNGLVQAGPQGVGNHMSPFNMESMMSEQKNAFMAQEAGQTVVPANTSQNRHANPQQGPNMQGQGMSNLQQTPNQPQRPQQPFSMQQANPHLQAQLRAQALAQAGKQAGLPGQPGGGPGGPPMTSQSPAMGTLNTPMANPPVSMGQMNVQATPNGVSQLDPRFMPRTPISMGGNVNNHMNPQVMLLLQRMTPEQRAQIQGLAPEQLNKLTAKWIESGSANMVGPQPGQLNNPTMENRNPGPNPALGMPGPPMPPQIGKMTHAQVVEYMDNMELPPQITRALPSLTIPVEIKTYKALKDWLQHNQLMPQYEPTVKQMQIMQFKAEMSKRIQQGQQPLQANQQGLPHQQQMTARPPQQPQNAGQGMGMPQSGPPPQGNAAPPNNQQQMLLELARSLPQHVIQPSPQDIETLRKQPRCAGFTDEQLFDLGRQIKAKNYLMRQQQQRNQQQQQQQRQAQQPQPNMPQPPQGHVGQPLAQLPHELNQNPAQKQPAPSGAAAPPTNEKQSPAMTAPTPTMMNRTQSQQGRAPQNAAQRRNLKRSSPDDVIDVTGPTPPPVRQQQPPQPPQPKQQVPQTQPQNQQRPAAPGPARPPSQQLTQEQLSKLSPENRAKYEAALRNRQVLLSVPSEVRERIQKMATEIGHEVAQVVQRDMDMPAAELAQLRQKIPFLFVQLQKAMKGFPQWYNHHGDEQRARLFIRYRHLVMHQFEDGNNASQLKQQLSVRLNDIEQALALVEGMTREMNALFNGAVAQARGPAAQQPNKPQPQAPRPQAAPEENFEANKAQAKPNNKAAQAPAGPAAQQPQYPGFGSLPKNTAVPAYLSKPAVTVDTLNPPPPKRKKPNSAQVSSPALQSAHGSPPQTKPPSPEARRENVVEAPKQPPRPLILCSEPNCDAAAAGFPSEEARNLHVQEEHIRPSQDPFKYLNESFAFAEAADQQKKLSAAAPVYQSQPQQSVAMQLTQSKDGSVATPTPGTVPMNRQASGVTGPLLAKPGQGMMGNTQPGATPVSSSAQDMGLPQPPPSAEDNLFTGTVVPNEIFAGVPSFGTTADGVISDPSLYRTHTPNDTPDSKDGSTSEPNSDIPDNANIEIDMAWATLDDDFLVNLNNFSVENTEGLDTSTNFMDWNDAAADFDKPFSFDGSNYVLEPN